MACLLALGGCETIPVGGGPERPRVEPTSPAAAAEAEAAGEYVLAAREYDRLADQSASPQRERYRLQAIASLLKGGQLQEARTRLNALEVPPFDASLVATKRVLDARLLLAEGAADRAIARLDEASRLRQLDPALTGEILEVRAQARRTLGQPALAVRDLSAREQYLVGTEAVAANQARLWDALESMSPEQLRGERSVTTDAIVAGWLDLALAVREQAGNAVGLAQAINLWRSQHAGHPAGAPLLDSLAARAPALVGRIERIALLLPLTSDFAVAAQAVRDGFLAMHAATPETERPKVTIYDVGSDPQLAPQVYDHAVRDGAQVIVGPLGREATDIIVRQGNLAVPTLLLNYTDEHPSQPALLYQFGLPPEQEARQAAERAYLDGCRQAGVLYPATAWGERMMNAFTAHWQRLSGLVLASQAYEENEGDYSEPVKRLLNIPQSEARRAAIEKKLNQRLQFEPRPRQDLECLFLAADAKRGRLIKPQLNYFRARNLPVYATSHIYAGKPDPIHDVDLDGVQFGDMPWMLMQNGRIAGLRQRLQGDWPNAHTDLDRLYALGIDSYAILPHLTRISAEQAGRFAGVTSGLSVNPDGRLHRQLAWAKFRNGVPRLLDAGR